MPAGKKSNRRQSASSCHVVPYSEQHKPLVAELQRHLWSPDPRLNLSYLEWKYHQNPYIQEPLIYLGFVGDKLVGMRGAFGTCWEVGDPPRVFTLPYPDDLVIHPAFRKQGLHRVIMNFALRDMARRGFRYAVNLSASRTTVLASLNMQWRDAGSVDTVYRRTAGKIVHDRLATLAGKLPLVWRWADKATPPGGDPVSSIFDRFDANLLGSGRRNEFEALFARSTAMTPEMSELVARRPRDGRFRHVRDEKFFAWRFRNPLHAYRFLYAGREQLWGYIVLQSRLTAPGRINVVDWEGEDSATRAKLLSVALRCGKFPDVCAWRLGSSADTARLLESHGFKSVARLHDHRVLIRSTSDDELADEWAISGRHLDDAREWDLRMLYSTLG